MFKLFPKRRSHYEFRNRRPITWWLAAPFRALFDLTTGEMDELGNRPPLGNRIWRLTLQVVFFPFYCIAQLLQFIILSWTTTRSLGAFGWGLAPLVIATAMVTAMVVSGFNEERLALATHREFTISAEESDEYEKAMLGSKRVQLVADEPQWKNIHAFTLMQAGKTANAEAILEELAPLDRPGHVPSHMYLAQQLQFDHEKDNSRKELLDLALRHLDHVLKLEPENIEAIVRTGRVKQQQGKMDEAVEIFKRVSNIDPTVVPDLLTYLNEHRQFEEARFHTQRGLDRLRRIAQVQPNEPVIWDLMYRILMASENYEEAIEELQRAFATVQEPSVRVRLLMLQSGVMVEFAKKIDPASSQDNFNRHLKSLGAALDLFPRNSEAQGALIDLILYSESAQMDVWLEEGFRTNLSPANNHLIQGIRDAVKGKPLSSKQHFRLALGGNPAAAIVVNEIAWITGMRKNKLEDAMRIIDVAIDTWTNPLLFQTRGEILMGMGRNDEALAELEYVASEMKENPRVLDLLADCHETLSHDALAKEFRDKANELRDELKLRAAEAGRS